MRAPSEEALEFIENKTYDEIHVGDGASLQRTLSERDIQLFAVMSGDVNPAHVDPEYAKNSMFHEVIAHGLWGGALISTVLGTLYPGPGTVYIDQTLHFSRPVTLGVGRMTLKTRLDALSVSGFSGSYNGVSNELRGAVTVDGRRFELNAPLDPAFDQADFDEDGAGNACDQCPESERGEPVDAAGCRPIDPALRDELDAIVEAILAQRFDAALDQNGDGTIDAQDFVLRAKEGGSP